MRSVHGYGDGCGFSDSTADEDVRSDWTVVRTGRLAQVACAPKVGEEWKHVT